MSLFGKQRTNLFSPGKADVSRKNSILSIMSGRMPGMKPDDAIGNPFDSNLDVEPNGEED